ncbi:putative ankyrin-repeat protein [Clarireedia jacksonii]
MEKPSEDKFAIHAACREGKTTIVESLLNANPKLAELKDDDERLPIHWAVSYNHLDIVILLSSLKGFDPDVQDGSGWTPLMIAVSLKEGDDIVELLLKKEADVNAKNFSNQTALHFSTSKNNLPITKLLLSQNPPASCRVKDKRGQYAIHRAAAIGSTPLVELLLKNKSPLNPTDIAGQTPLHHAIAEGHGDTAVALLKAGAETDKKDVDGFLALDLAPDKQVKKYIVQMAEMEGIDL